MPFALLSTVLLPPSPTTPLLNSNSVLSSGARHVSQALRTPEPSVRFSLLSNSAPLIAGRADLYSAPLALNSVPHNVVILALNSVPNNAVQPSELAHLPASVIKIMMDGGYFSPPAPLSLFNRFAALPSQDPVINLSGDTDITPSGNLIASGIVPAHTSTALYPLVGLPAHTPSPSGKHNVSFPSQGLGKEYKNLQNLPRFMCWDPANTNQQPTPKKWISDLPITVICMVTSICPVFCPTSLRVLHLTGMRI